MSGFGQPPPQQQQPMMEHQREPCPDRIIDDIGGAFAMGAVGGGAWHMIKGLKNSPSGFRLRGAVEAVRRESPRLGGSFANWGLSFSMFDCTLQYLRKKEDPWNAIGAGALTGGFLQLRFGLKSAAKSAAFGGFLLALIEGLGIALNKLTSPPPPGLPYQPPAGGMAPAPAGGPGGPPPPAPAGADFGSMHHEVHHADAGPSTSGMHMGAPSSSAASTSGSAGASSSGGGGWFSGLFGSSEPAKPPAPVHTQDLTLDPFTAPPIPTEFQTDKYK